jgi:hypothetical protein
LGIFLLFFSGANPAKRYNLMGQNENPTRISSTVGAMRFVVYKYANVVSRNNGIIKESIFEDSFFTIYYYSVFSVINLYI